MFSGYCDYVAADGAFGCSLDRPVGDPYWDTGANVPGGSIYRISQAAMNCTIPSPIITGTTETGKHSALFTIPSIVT